MKKGLFTGWQSVFAFTFKQDTKGKFVRNTLIFLLLMFVGGMAISTIMAISQKKDDETISPIQKVYLVNESNLTVIPTEQFVLMHREAFPEVVFEDSEKTSKELAGELKESANDVILAISDDAGGYLLTCILPEASEVSEKEAEAFLEAFMDVAEAGKLMSSDISMEKLVVALSGVHVNQIDAGEAEKSMGEELVYMLLPMVVVLLLYIFVFIYGMTMGNAVSVEKTSKLMEMMLTMTRPYAMVLGKILALVSAAIIQLLVWIAGLIAGFLAGDVLAKNLIYPEYTNDLLVVIKLLKASGVGNAFSVGAFVLFAIDICISILFYCLLAATFGSLATKTEEVAQSMGYFQIFVVLGFLGSYLVPMQEKPWLDAIMRLIPFCSAFMLPGDVLVGKINLLQGSLYTLLLAAFTIGLILIAGKVYMNQLFYRGESIFARLKNRSGKAKA